MATVKLFSLTEQNAATLAGVEVTSATFTGTNTAADLTLRVGRNAPVIQIVGTQTAATSYVALDTANATHGATFTVTRNTLTAGTGIISLFSGLAGTGFVAANEVARIGFVSTGTGQALNNVGMAVVAFDGVAQVWR